jgi:hypothetical protein
MSTSNSSSASRVLLAVLATSAIGQGAGESVRGDLASSLADSGSTRQRLAPSLVDAVRSACPQQIGQCEKDEACAQELNDLAEGKKPISAHAQELVRCVKGDELLLELNAAGEKKKSPGACSIQ